MNTYIQGGAGETIGKLLLVGFVAQFIVLALAMIIGSVIGVVASQSVAPDKKTTAIVWGIGGLLVGGLLLWYSTSAFNWATCLWCDSYYKSSESSTS